MHQGHGKHYTDELHGVRAAIPLRRRPRAEKCSMRALKKGPHGGRPIGPEYAN